jgi:hypothetical protein
LTTLLLPRNTPLPLGGAALDGLPLLARVDIRLNGLSGPLPALAGGTGPALVLLDLSSNLLNGACMPGAGCLECHLCA